jgi:hypothetical protein
MKSQDGRLEMTNYKLYDTIETLVDLPAFGLKSGAVGTIVDLLPNDAFEVDFGVDDEGNIVTAGLYATQIELIG